MTQSGRHCPARLLTFSTVRASCLRLRETGFSGRAPLPCPEASGSSLAAAAIWGHCSGSQGRLGDSQSCPNPTIKKRVFMPSSHALYHSISTNTLLGSRKEIYVRIMWTKNLRLPLLRSLTKDPADGRCGG